MEQGKYLEPLFFIDRFIKGGNTMFRIDKGKTKVLVQFDNGV